MLQQLHINNYAIIDEMAIDFAQKLNVITGETGAGKSILVGALALTLGERADVAVIMEKARKCVVEVTFSVKDRPGLKEFMDSNDLDLEESVVIRREIAGGGKSRAFVNDTPVNLEQLRKLGSLLVDLHQQFDSLDLAEAAFQREVLDALAGNFPLLQQYRESYRQWRNAVTRLAQLEEEKSRATREHDYDQFLFNELEEADLHENELEDLEAELRMLSHAEGIRSALGRVHFGLEEDEQHVVQQLRMAVQQLQAYADFHPGLPKIIERLQSAQIEVRDIAGEIGHLQAQVQSDPGRIEKINDRLALGYKLLKKHGLRATAELISLKKSLEGKLRTALNLDEQIISTAKEAEAFFRECSALAERLSVNRRQQTDPLERKINRLLAQVGMPNARLQVLCTEGELADGGKDQIEFLFDANKSNRFSPVRKVASGGELSRLMLCIKSLVAESMDLPTLIFDEIDSGISGEAAKQVGILLKELAAKRQVICITHQPQIAGRADAHFLVYKMNKGETIKTGIRILSKEERIRSIAEMLSGERPTAAALQNAREMVAG